MKPADAAPVADARSAASAPAAAPASRLTGSGVATPGVSTPGATVIELRGLRKTYHTGGEDVQALKPLDVAFREGQFVAIMGPSGSGKSTLLNLLGLLDRPSEGHYFLDAEDVARLDDDRLSEIRCGKIGFIFQSFNLFPTLTVLENVCMPMRYAERPQREMRPLAERLLERVGLADRMTHRPNQLSGGQCQRVAIARALANEPRFLLADEPTGNLDEKTGAAILALFHELRDEGRTILMVTHNPEYEHEVERTLMLHDGRVTRDTAPVPLAVDAATPEAAP